MTQTSSSATNQGHPRVQPLSNPIVHSESLRMLASILTCEEAQQIRATAQGRPRQQLSIWRDRWEGFCRFCDYRLLNLFPHKALCRLIVRWPKLEALVPSIRRHGRLAALVDRAQIESGGELSASEPAILARRLASYKEEWPRLRVISQASQISKSPTISSKLQTWSEIPASIAGVTRNV
jgi:hypothetical protein